MLDVYELYELLQEIANSKSDVLKKKYGTDDFKEIILKHSLNDLYSIWYDEI